MKDTIKQSTYVSYRSYLNKHFCVLGENPALKSWNRTPCRNFITTNSARKAYSPKTLRNYHMALHKCLQQAVKERLLVYNPLRCRDPAQRRETRSRSLYQRPAACAGASQLPPPLWRVYPLRPVYRAADGGVAGAEVGGHRLFHTQLHVRRTINRLAKYEAHDGENKTEIVFGTPKTKTLAADSADPHNKQTSLPAGNNSKRRIRFGQGISTPTMVSSSPTNSVTTLSRKLSRITTTAC